MAGVAGLATSVMRVVRMPSTAAPGPRQPSVGSIALMLAGRPCATFVISLGSEFQKPKGASAKMSFVMPVAVVPPKT